MGRVPTEKWGPRIIDLDLLIYRDSVVREPDLVLPHPHIKDRAFVLAPLMDIAPDAMLGDQSVRELYEAIDLGGVRPLAMRPKSKAPQAHGPAALVHRSVEDRAVTCWLPSALNEPM